MSPLVKVMIAAGGGAFLSQYLEPHLAKLAVSLPAPVQKAVGPASVAISAGGVYYLLGKS